MEHNTSTWLTHHCWHSYSTAICHLFLERLTCGSFWDSGFTAWDSWKRSSFVDRKEPLHCHFSLLIKTFMVIWLVRQYSFYSGMYGPRISRYHLNYGDQSRPEHSRYLESSRSEREMQSIALFVNSVKKLDLRNKITIRHHFEDICIYYVRKFTFLKMFLMKFLLISEGVSYGRQLAFHVKR